MYYGENGQTYGDMEESVLACLLLEPSYIESLIVSEKHFKKYGYILTFFKEFYQEYHNLDISIMFSVVDKNSEFQLMEAITYLLDIFVLENHCLDYQKQLLKLYAENQKEQWLRKKIFEKATKLYVGNITCEKFVDDVNKLIARADEVEWS